MPPRRRPGSGRAWVGSGHLAAPPQVSFWLPESSGILGTSAFVWSISKNISYVTFLKYKNSRKQELTLRHLVNRLVPENAKYSIKMHIKHVGIETKKKHGASKNIDTFATYKNPKRMV